MSEAGEPVAPPRQNVSGCERCSKIPWDSLLDDDTVTDGTVTEISWDSLAYDTKESVCEVCSFLEKHCPRLSESGRLEFYYVKQHPFFEEQLDTKSRHVCCISDLPHFVAFGSRNILATRIQPSEIKPALQHVLPEKIDISKLKTWIADCRDNHNQHCALLQNPSLPGLKVIDCEHRIVVQAPDNCRFAALSYIWGDQNLDTVDHNALETAPKTISDTIQLAKNLGLKYLWIDRYCIDQSNTTEKHTQILQMGQIYLAADLTIVAATGRNPSHGLPGLQLVRKFDHMKVGLVHLYAIPELQGLKDVIESPWAQRAWTYQEGIFSRRRLIFTERQVIYVCNTQTQHEAPLPPSFWYVNRRDEDYRRGWTPTVTQQQNELLESKNPLSQALDYLEAYSYRKLSYDSDAVNAIDGALHSLVKDNVYHICGVPIHLPPPIVDSNGSVCGPEPSGNLALLWHHLQPGCNKRAGFPSWSPVGWDGEIGWELDSWDEHRVPCAINTKTCRILRGSEEYGCRSYAQLKASHASQLLLKLDAQIVDLVLYPASRRSTSRRSRAWPSDQFGVMTTFNEALDVLFWPRWDIDPKTDVGLASLVGIFFQIEKTGWPDDICLMILRARGGHYERVGIRWLWRHGWKQRGPNTPKFLDKAGQIISSQDSEALGFERVDWSNHEWWQRLVRNETIVLC